MAQNDYLAYDTEGKRKQPVNPNPLRPIAGAFGIKLKPAEPTFATGTASAPTVVPPVVQGARPDDNRNPAATLQSTQAQESPANQITQGQMGTSIAGITTQRPFSTSDAEFNKAGRFNAADMGIINAGIRERAQAGISQGATEIASDTYTQDQRDADMQARGMVRDPSGNWMPPGGYGVGNAGAPARTGYFDNPAMNEEAPVDFSKMTLGEGFAKAGAMGRQARKERLAQEGAAKQAELGIRGQELGLRRQDLAGNQAERAGQEQERGLGIQQKTQQMAGESQMRELRQKLSTLPEGKERDALTQQINDISGAGIPKYQFETEQGVDPATGMPTKTLYRVGKKGELVPAVGGQQQGAVVKVGSKQELDALPSGTQYTAPDGSIRVKR